jgi:uncharacterized protein YjbI with pentapeptide repeats
MANEEHLSILTQGAGVWNQWRDENPKIEVDLSGEDLTNVDFSGEDLTNVDLSGANLTKADLGIVRLSQANLSGANLHLAQLNYSDLTNANLSGADLRLAQLMHAVLNEANLSGANLHLAQLNYSDLTNANLSGADLRFAQLMHVMLNEANLRKAVLISAVLDEADLTNANFSGADLSQASLIGAKLLGTNFENADLTGCWIYGVAAWNLKINEDTNQSSLNIAQRGEPIITVDNLEVAQFIYLLLNRQKLRNIIDTITSKTVLILGRFTPERKAVLHAMANELRKNNLLPIIFDFERATSRDFTETIKTLAGLSLFVIADITNPKSAPLELQATIPDYQIPFIPIIEKGEKPFSMFRDLPKFPWVLKLLTYPSLAVLIEGFKKAIIDEAFEMHKKLLILKAKDMEIRKVEDYLGEK